MNIAASPGTLAERIASMKRDEARSAVRSCTHMAEVKEVSRDDTRKTIRDIAYHRLLQLEVLDLTGDEEVVKAPKKAKKVKAPKPKKALPDVPEGHKWCPKCLVFHPLAEFGTRKMKRTRKDGEVIVTERPQSYCTRARNGHAKALRQKRAAKKRAAEAEISEATVEDFTAALKAQLAGEE